ncbi:hypothetical protein J0X14_08305 [Muricauda sp. CAU 1633]|uniref:hypothetical protein n=1 Tax=Allomuricauda sp. CAU 1633 TaxID=2816036 RepID=UPI001A8FC4A1|nr:hypothetical protein [Muricauda sp. CAU 1633]MBO0322294.1 hypothetical protein [Muricauda sp. CAU 1633]
MRISTTLLFLLFAVVGRSQNVEIPQQMKDLHFLEGTWSLENFENKQGEGWVSTGVSNATIALEHDGRFISEHAKYITGFGEINMITHIGFDSRINSYKLSAMDKEYGLMDIYVGEWVDENLVFTNLQSDEPIRMEDNRELSFKLSYTNFGPKTFTHLVEGTFDKGQTWFPFSKSVYTKDN